MRKTRQSIRPARRIPQNQASAPALGRRQFLEGFAWALATSTCALPGGDAEGRDQVLYVIIDRPEDAQLQSHAPNIEGLRTAATAFDLTARVTPVTIADLAGIDMATLDATYRPLAIFGAGSFTEWFQYGVDARWRQDVDHWMSLIRETTIPMLAVCGSHELVALTFNGFGAVAHISDRGTPVRISEELAASPPRPMWPNPRVGEEGTYPIARTEDGADDAIAGAMPDAPMVASHHKDMVVDTTGFTVLYEGDGSRSPATQAVDQAAGRCRVQATRLDDPRRLLYTTQFHPEMTAFNESTAGDGGFGAAWLQAFFTNARRWWSAASRVQSST
jgi:hypothetical protein